MPTPGLSLRCGPAVIVLNDDGEVVSVHHDERPELSLGSVAGADVVIDSAARRSSTAHVTFDPDEVELSTDLGPLRLVLRHSFVAGWTMRLVLANLGPDPVALERVQVLVTPGPGCVGVALPAGAEAAYVIQPADGCGPLLGGRLWRGRVVAITSDGLDLGPSLIAPGGRQVLHWRWRWFESPYVFAEEWLGVLPAQTTHVLGEAVSLRSDPDTALVAPDGVDIAHEGDARLIAADRPGRYPVELRSARGDVVLELRWTDPWEDRLATWAAQLLAGPRTPVGVCRLDGVAEALVVQQALLRPGMSHPTEAEESLDLFTARLSGQADLGPLAALYLLGEYSRVADVALLQEALRIVAEQTRARPGLGLALLRLNMSLTVAGAQLDVRVVPERLLHEARSVGRLGTAPLTTDRLAAAELLAATSGSGGSMTPAVADLVGRLTSELGAGLPGRPIHTLSDPQRAYRVAVLGMIPDEMVPTSRRQWGGELSAVVRRAITELLADTAGELPVEAAGWLAVSGTSD